MANFEILRTFEWAFHCRPRLHTSMSLLLVQQKQTQPQPQL
jgi:hypothetical protein